MRNLRESPQQKEEARPGNRAFLTPAELEKIESDGVLVIRQLFDADFVEVITGAWNDLAEQVRAGKAMKRSRRFVLGSLPSPLGDIYRHPGLLALASQILGFNLALYMNRVLLKDETWREEVKLHSDMPYYNGSPQKITFFVPLAPTQACNGGLIFVKGSHHYGYLSRGEIDRSSFGGMDDLRPDLVPGDVVVMNPFTWHCSEPTSATSERPILQIVLQSATDGSFGGEDLGVCKPTIAQGEWQTVCFSQVGKGVLDVNV
jgi:Phytanoyl-CoA dioxygenase (PhyH)